MLQEHQYHQGELGWLTDEHHLKAEILFKVSWAREG